MTLTIDEMGAWEVPALIPPSANPAEPAKPIDNRPVVVMPTLDAYPRPPAKPFVALLVAFVVGLLVGFMICDRYTSILPDGGGSDQQERVVPDDQKHAAAENRDMIFVCEVGDTNKDSFELDRMWERIRDYAEKNGISARRYDSDQGSATPSIEYAKKKGIIPPFVTFKKNGDFTGVKTIKEMEKVLK